jgi:hypothetical protein
MSRKSEQVVFGIFRITEDHSHVEASVSLHQHYTIAILVTLLF